MVGWCDVLGFFGFLKKYEISDFLENISLVIKIKGFKSVVFDVFVWWVLYIDSLMKIFSFFIDIFLFLDLYMNLVKLNLIIVCFFFV